MAPEIFQEDGVHSFYSDMWSLGWVLYELATGKPPFYSDSFKALVKMIQYDPIPTLEGVSNEFNDILSKLLEKEPTCRPSWEELSNHPFWGDEKFTSLSLPEEPQFDRYLKAKGIDPKHFYETRSNPLAKKLIRESAKVGKDKQVDIIRLSHNVKNNMKQPDNYSQKQDHSSDIKLKNRDVELNFGKRESTPTKELIIDPSPHKGDIEEEMREEDKIDYNEGDFIAHKGPNGNSNSN